MHGITVTAPQGLVFVTATNCVVSVYMCYVDDSNRTLDFKSTRAEQVAAEPQQRYNTSAHISYSTVYSTGPVVFHFPREYTARVINKEILNQPPDLPPGYIVYHPPCGVMPSNLYNTPKIPRVGCYRYVSKHAVPGGVRACQRNRYLIGWWQRNSFSFTVITPVMLYFRQYTTPVILCIEYIYIEKQSRGKLFRAQYVITGGVGIRRRTQHCAGGSYIHEV